MFSILNFGHSYLFRISCLGFRIYKKLIKQIISKLQQVTSLNDLALSPTPTPGSTIPYLF